MKKSTQDSRAVETNEGDFPGHGVPSDYDDHAADQDLDRDDSTETGDQPKRGFSSTITQGRAFLNEVVELPNGGFAFKLCLLCGGQDDKEHRIYGDFYASKRLHKWAASQVGIQYEQGTICEVEILNLRAVPSHGREGKIFENYRGLLTRLSFGR